MTHWEIELNMVERDDDICPLNLFFILFWLSALHDLSCYLQPVTTINEICNVMREFIALQGGIDDGYDVL